MNFSTFREIYVEQALRNLGHENPAFQRSNLPAVTNQYVLGRLDTFPDLIQRVKGLQAEQESFRPTDEVQRELKVFCLCAGRRLVRAYTTIEDLRGLLKSCSPEAAFLHHRVLIECLLHTRESLAFWEESIDAKEFYGRHVRSNEVRFQYLELTIRLVLIVVDLTFPEDLHPYVEELEYFLGWRDVREQLQFDNAETYARSKKLVRVGLSAPHNRIPKRFIPYGLRKLRPFWYRNPSVYGHLQVPNQSCIRQRKNPKLHSKILHGAIASANWVEMPIIAKLLSSWLGADEPAKPTTQAPVQQAQATTPPQPTQPTQPSPLQPAPQNVPFSPHRTPEERFRRSAKQLGLFFAGAGFLAMSTMVTRRAVARKIAEASPRLFQPSHHGPRPAPRNADEKVQDQLVAAEALGLATLNVFGFGIMLTGGLSWAFDISNLEDLRTKARAKLYGANGVVDEAAEKEIEEWIADVLSRKDKKNEEGTPPKKEG
ncbi:hypothetical protein VMCG_02089 [Cytospora schulzeri]|uniref:Altered inheritance of mitochondria protein 11 n=1 Tax=Cytospora schulzeri TaxID=448051 RepID=A0A423X409_9PEZI|nr:hypothetical protein VMCG_02089 [Valsa malicola]